MASKLDGATTHTQHTQVKTTTQRYGSNHIVSLVLVIGCGLRPATTIAGAMSWYSSVSTSNGNTGLVRVMTFIFRIPAFRRLGDRNVLGSYTDCCFELVIVQYKTQADVIVAGTASV